MSTSTSGGHLSQTKPKHGRRPSGRAYLRITSVVVLIAAAGCLIHSGISKNQGDPPHIQFDRTPFLLAIIALGGGFVLGSVLSAHDTSLTRLFILQPIKVGIDAHLTDDNSFHALKLSFRYNVVMTYMAAGCLLALLAWTAASKAATANRLETLQFAMLMGAALFSATSYTYAQLADWAKALLDPVNMAQTNPIIDRVAAFWGMLGSAFLVTAGGATYVAVIAGRTEAPSTARTGMLAITSVDGTDVKFFGWLINGILVLSLLWAAVKLPAVMPS